MHDGKLPVMAYTLGQAAKATGKSKTAIAQAINDNRISATKNEQGQWQIDPAELHRVYAPKNTHVDEREHQPDTEIVRLRATVEGLEKLCRQIEGERDNLRDRLDREGEERRRLTAILTDQREKPIITPPPEPTAQGAAKRKSWFGWLTG